jgi:hypothetical protein
MKSVSRLLVAVMLVMVSATANAAQRILKEFTGKEKVTTAYVSEDMAGVLPLGDFLNDYCSELRNRYRSITASVEVVQIEDAAMIKSTYADYCDKFVDRIEALDTSEVTTEAYEEGQIVRVISMKEKVGTVDMVQGLLIYTREPDSISLVAIHFTPRQPQ